MQMLVGPYLLPLPPPSAIITSASLFFSTCSTKCRKGGKWRVLHLPLLSPTCRFLLPAPLDWTSEMEGMGEVMEEVASRKTTAVVF